MKPDVAPTQQQTFEAEENKNSSVVKWVHFFPVLKQIKGC